MTCYEQTGKNQGNVLSGQIALKGGSEGPVERVVEG